MDGHTRNPVNSSEMLLGNSHVFFWLCCCEKLRERYPCMAWSRSIVILVENRSIMHVIILLNPSNNFHIALQHPQRRLLQDDLHRGSCRTSFVSKINSSASQQQYFKFHWIEWEQDQIQKLIRKQCKIITLLDNTVCHREKASSGLELWPTQEQDQSCSRHFPSGRICDNKCFFTTSFSSYVLVLKQFRGSSSPVRTVKSQKYSQISSICYYLYFCNFSFNSFLDRTLKESSASIVRILI